MGHIHAAYQCFVYNITESSNASPKPYISWGSHRAVCFTISQEFWLTFGSYSPCCMPRAGTSGKQFGCSEARAEALGHFIYICKKQQNTPVEQGQGRIRTRPHRGRSSSVRTLQPDHMIGFVWGRQGGGGQFLGVDCHPLCAQHARQTDRLRLQAALCNELLQNQSTRSPLIPAAGIAAGLPGAAPPAERPPPGAPPPAAAGRPP